MSLNKKQQKNQEIFIRCIAQPLGFSVKRLIAACIVYKCLLHWRYEQNLLMAMPFFFLLFLTCYFQVPDMSWPIGYPMPLNSSC
jgi:hypothetical protein